MQGNHVIMCECAYANCFCFRPPRAFACIKCHFFFFANDETGLNAKIKAEATKMLTPRGGEKREKDSAPGYAMEKDTGFCEPQ